MKSGIYKILNKITEKYYIGSAVNLKARWTQHKGKLRSNIHPNKFLQSSWNLHGEEAFEFVILEYCDKEKLPVIEQKWLDDTNCYDRNIGYNLYKIAGSPLGSKWSEERKIEARERMTGFKHTEEAKAKMKEAQKTRGDAWNNKISASKIGHSVSEETKNKIGLKNSDPEKWPCLDKAKCKCSRCRAIRAKYNRDWRKIKKNEVYCVQV